MADVAIVIGHHPDAQGAHLTLGDLSVSEFRFWKPFARELANTFGENVGPMSATYVIERPNPSPGSYLVHKINRTGADCAIELHFNAHDGRARGTEMLHWAGSSGGERLARLLHDYTTDALDTKARGLVEKSSGYPFLRDTAMPAVICEPGFGSHRGDAWKLLVRQTELMKAYRDAILDYLGEGV